MKKRKKGKWMWVTRDNDTDYRICCFWKSKPIWGGDGSWYADKSNGFVIPVSVMEYFGIRMTGGARSIKKIRMEVASEEA